MTVPASGELSLGKIRQELETSDYSAGPYTTNATSLSGSETGLYAAINTASPSYPNGTAPFAMSEWYSYNHAATSFYYSTPVTVSFTTNVIPWCDYDRMAGSLWITSYGHEYGSTSETLDLKIIDSSDFSTKASKTVTYRPGESTNQAQRKAFNTCTIGTGSAGIGVYNDTLRDLTGFILKDNDTLTTSTIDTTHWLFNPRVYYGGFHNSNHYFAAAGHGTGNNGPTTAVFRIDSALSTFTKLTSSPFQPFTNIFNYFNEGVFLNTTGPTLYFLFLYNYSNTTGTVRATVLEIDTSTNSISNSLTNTGFITSTNMGLSRANPGFGVNIADNYAIVPIYMSAGYTRLHLIKWDPSIPALTIEDTLNITSGYGADISLNPIDSGSFKDNQDTGKLLLTARTGSQIIMGTLDFTTSSLGSLTNIVEISSTARSFPVTRVIDSSQDLNFASFGADNKPQLWSGSGYL